jgi:hypothetical protein
VETVPERLEPRPEPLELRSVGALVTEPAPVAESVVEGASPGPARRRRPRITVRREILWVLAIYLATRILLLLTAYVQSAIGHHDFLHELSNWDGLWYREIANQGYLNHPSNAQTTLGFFPLFPLSIWLLEPAIRALSGADQIWASSVAGVIISGIGGAIACVYVFRLAESWWDREVARRAAVLFILFPGSVVFSMAYSEGLLLPLVAACLYALQRKRWLQAGILAGFATAVQPVALALIPVCGVSALLELHRQGYRPRTLRRVAVAPLLSGVGIASFAIFLWAWTGTPLANYQAQHHGWNEKTDPLALVHLTTTLANQVSFSHFNQPTINLNLVVGLIGALLLGVMLVMVAVQWRRIPIEAIIWTAAISLLALTSEFVPPNPRMLLTAFPALMAAARYARGRWWSALVWANTLLLVGLSLLTFYGTTLRP